jgi:HEAT repeat protein
VSTLTPNELVALLHDPSVPFEQRRDRIKTLPDVRSSVAVGLQTALEAGDWGTFELLLLVAFQQPDPNYVPALTAALSLQVPEVPNEDALEVLADIGDPSTLDLLKKIALTEHDWDEFSQIGVKAVWAIAAIDTPQATAALAEIAGHGDEYVRHWAESKIKQR